MGGEHVGETDRKIDHNDYVPADVGHGLLKAARNNL